MVRATGIITNSIATFSGTLDDLKQYRLSTFISDYSYLHMAVQKNDINMVRWLLENGCPTTKFAHE